MSQSDLPFVEQMFAEDVEGFDDMCGVRHKCRRSWNLDYGIVANELRNMNMLLYGNRSWEHTLRTSTW